MRYVEMGQFHGIDWKNNNNLVFIFYWQLKNYRNKRNFFEMMRFDLIVDDNLRVFLMEANMSPNLSSAHFTQNTLLYEQVIYSLMNLVGVGSSVHRESLRTRLVEFFIRRILIF